MMWLWLARKLRDLSCWAYSHTTHGLDYNEWCLGCNYKKCNVRHEPGYYRPNGDSR